MVKTFAGRSWAHHFFDPEEWEDLPPEPSALDAKGKRPKNRATSRAAQSTILAGPPIEVGGAPSPRSRAEAGFLDHGFLDDHGVSKGTFSSPADVSSQEKNISSAVQDDLGRREHHLPPPQFRAGYEYEVVCDENSSAQLGLGYIRNEVTRVLPGSWAESVGILPGDQIVAANGQSFSELPEHVGLGLLQGTSSNSSKDTGKQKANHSADTSRTRPPARGSSGAGALRKNRLTLRLRRPELRAKFYELQCAEPRIGIQYVRTQVTDIAPDGWAAQNGVEVGDEIVALDGRDFRGMSDAEKVRAATRAEPRVLRFQRPDRKPGFFEVEAAERGPLGLVFGFSRSEAEGGSGCPVVSGVTGWAERSGVERGDALVRIDGARTEQLGEARVLDLLKQERPLQLQVRRDGILVLCLNFCE